jgi:hypothetical protein
MFSTLSSSDYTAYTWPEDELARLNSYMAGLPSWAPSATSGAMAPIGHIGSTVDGLDPLAELTPWQIYQDCIWLSDEDTNTKIMLLCISRFMNKNLRGSSMSYTAIAAACGFAERTAKRAAKAVRERWLRIEVGKGRYWPGKGNENLYHGIIPEKWRAELRPRKAKGRAVSIDERVATAAESIVATLTGVTVGHPDHDYGVLNVHPERDRGDCMAQPGCPIVTLTPHTPHRRKDFPRGGVARITPTSPSMAEVNAGFDEWWAHYPRKEAKFAAKKAYAAIVTGTHRNPECRATIPQLLTALKAYKFPSDPQFIKHPATWLNDGSWADVARAAPNALEAQIESILKTQRGREIVAREGEAAARAYLRTTLSSSSASNGGNGHAAN